MLILLASLFVSGFQGPGFLDFSRAGFGAGADLPPPSERRFEPGEHGGKPDDGVDDSAAIQAAIDAASAAGGGTVVLGPGTWRLESPVALTGDGVVLRGAGSELTIFDCPNSLADVHGWKPGWSWGNGFVEVHPAKGSTSNLGAVDTVVERGLVDLPLTLAPNAKPPVPGEWLELTWTNDLGTDSLLLELHGNLLPRSAMGRELRDATGPRVRSWVQAVAWAPGGASQAQLGEPEQTGGDRGDAEEATDESAEAGTLTIEAPLRLDLRPEWSPRLARTPSITGCGIEGLSFRFPRTEYPGHLKERGYNAIQLSRAIDCWVTDVATRNADSGLFLSRSKRVTARGLQLTGRYMHHPISLSWSTDCLVEDWIIDAPHRHGTTLSWSAHGNVLRRGEGLELALDCHRAAPFENLHEDLVVRFPGKPTQPLRSGGSSPRGPHAGRGNLYWNVELRFEQPGQRLALAGQDEWPGATFAGWRAVGGELQLEPAPGIGQRVLHLGSVAPAYPGGASASD
ncbi:MAG: glycosyl hydrolase family 28-related protein [Planctomycetota bacterium]|nr:glycosyl hydrolase family 28-related protein [Planctomycetota bacterium]